MLWEGETIRGVGDGRTTTVDKVTFLRGYHQTIYLLYALVFYYDLSTRGTKTARYLGTASTSRWFLEHQGSSQFFSFSFDRSLGREVSSRRLSPLEAHTVV